MKKYLLAIIGILLVCLGLFLTARSCKITDQLSLLKGRYEEAEHIAAANNAILDKKILEQEGVIAEQDKVIIKLNKSVSIIYTDIGHRDRDIADLLAKLREAEANNDLPAQIANLKEQVRIWSEKFTLAQAVIAEKDDIIASWATKYASQIQISDSWKLKYESENHLRLLAEEGWNLTAKKLSRSSWANGIKTAIIYAGCVVVGLEVIKNQVNKGA